MLSKKEIPLSVMRQAAMEGEELPVEELPDLDPHLIFYFIAFIDLSSERMVEGGQIPWSKIELYATTYCLDQEQRDRLHFITRKLEKVVDEHNEKKREAEQKKASRKSGRRNKRR